MISDKTNILLVEDERIIAEYNSLVLQKHGYSVQCAFTGEDAVRIALSNNYISLILMDINLGEGINGIQAAEIISEERLIPILFLSHNIDLETVKRIEAFIPYGFLSKSSSESLLIISIITALRLFERYKNLVKQIA
ncbi:MAG TPA: response regulator [Spirochaetota bacterium]|nr:response regulator [Spirochaetota bacterium]HPR49645.1 response regulator [Spirochaetota bacterium]